MNEDQKTQMIEAEVATWPEAKRQFYRKMVKAGQSPAFAQMAACRQAPTGETDKSFMAKSTGIADQPLDDYTRGHITARARRNGYSPRATDTYDPLVAAYPGDPAAFTNHGDGREKIKRAKQRLAEPTQGDPHAKVHELHPDIVEKNRQHLLKQDPGLKEKDQREVTEMIIDRHALKTK